MEKSWYRKLVSRLQRPGSTSTQAKADDGDADAQFALGLRCGSRPGEARDFAQAAHWYRKAADQNHPLAQFNLGIMYAKGQGLPQDDAEAVVWIRRAAAQGDAGAYFHLGMRSYRASVSGLPKDVNESRVEAYKWFHLAAAEGYKDSDAACERVTLTMSGDEVAEGNHRAAAFVSGKSTSFVAAP